MYTKVSRWARRQSWRLLIDDCRLKNVHTKGTKVFTKDTKDTKEDQRRERRGAERMMKRAAVLASVVVMVGFGTLAFGQGEAAVRVTVLQCGTLIDWRSNEVRHNVKIVVRGNKIESVGPIRAASSGPPRLKPGEPMPGGGAAEAAPLQSNIAADTAGETIDLRNATCLPGLIDTHTHIVLQGDIIVDYDEQLLKQSAAYRAIRAVWSSEKCLEHGFTSIRD